MFGIDNLVGIVTSKTLSPVLGLKPRIVKVLIQLLKCCTFVFSFWTLELLFLLLWKCIVAIMQLSLMLATKVNISTPGIYRFTATCHYIWDLSTRKHILTLYVLSEDILGDILTKLLARSSFQQLTFTQGTFEIWASAWGEALACDCFAHYSSVYVTWGIIEFSWCTNKSEV